MNRDWQARHGFQRRGIASLPVLAFASFAASGVAQPPARAAPPADTARPQDIVVTASKHPMKLSEVGGAISVVSGDTLRNMNASKIQDYLGFVPGVSLTSFGRPGQTQVSIRGISSQSVGPAVAAYVDEIPFGSSSNESQGAAYTPDIDPADLQQVEVLKGPQGTLYGASSLGGLIKYVTRPPSLTETELETGEEVGFVDHGDVSYKFRAAGTTPIIRDVLGIRLSGYYRRDPGFVDNVYLNQRNVNRGDGWGMRGSVLLKPTDRLQIKLGALIQDNRGHSIDEVDYTSPPPFVPTYGNLKNSRYLVQPSHVNNRVYSAEIHYDLGPVNIVSATGVTRQDIGRLLDVTSIYGTRYRRYLGITPGDGSTIGLDARYDIHKTTQELRVASDLNGKFEWTIGGFYQDEHSKTRSVATLKNAQGVVAPDPIGHPIGTASNNQLREYAAFVNATYYIVPKVDITAGYRYSAINQNNFKLSTGIIYNGPADPNFDITRVDISKDRVSTYALGLRWRPSRHLLFYGRAASGFRPGGGRTLPPAAQAIGLSPVYQPDRVWSYEAGVKGRALNDRLAIDVDVFWIDWKNIQNLQLVEGIFLAGNAGKARSRGVETDIQYEPIRGLNLTASFAYTDAIYTQGNEAAGIAPGDRLNAIAKYTASLRAEYQRAISYQWRGFLGGDVQYRSSELDVVNTKMPEYALLGLHIGAENDRLRASAFVTNLTDKVGILGNTTGATSYAVVQPRTIGISLTQRF